MFLRLFQGTSSNAEQLLLKLMTELDHDLVTCYSILMTELDHNLVTYIMTE